MLQKSTRETVEYYTPKRGFDVRPYIEAGEKQGIHHVGRYQWACLALQERQPKTVLDVACGAGYGTFMLAQALANCEVTGADYDARAVEYAREHYPAANSRYVSGDLTTWQSESGELGRFDAIVSFDTIEHLLHRELALMRIADHINDDGCLCLSTPCGRHESLLNPPWQHHKLEYSHYDLHGLLSRFFKRVLQPQDLAFPAGHFWPQVVNNGSVRYLNRMNPVVCCEPIRVPRYRPAV